MLEVAAAVGSLAAVLIIVALVMSSGDDEGGGGIASGGLDSTVPASPGLDPDGGPNDGRGPTEFTSNIDLGDDEGDAGTPTTGGPTTSGGQADPSSTTATTDGGASTTSTSSGSTSTTGGGSTTSSSTTSSTTTMRPTTTTRPTTSSSSTTSTSTTTTQPTAVPIQIVSGPTVNVVNARSFQFNYSTNDVCGTGSFRVTNNDTGVVAGTFTGENVCFGPVHGGFPGLQGSAEFRHFDLEPATTYRVVVTVRGTASDGSRTAGSGTDSRSFDVTTAGG